MRELTSEPGGLTAALLGPLVAADPHRPRLVWYGNGRTELSTASLANWAAKTAGFLTDELGAQQGDTVVWRVRRSWQGISLLLGSWWAGMAVCSEEDAAGDAVVAFIDDDDESAADEVVVASPHPFGLAIAGLRGDFRQVGDAVLPHADRFIPRRPAPSLDSPALVTATASLSMGDLLERATLAADAMGRQPVVLSRLDPAGIDGIATGLLGALAADGTLVHVTPAAEYDAAGLLRLAREERVTVTLGVDVQDRPRLV